MKQSLRLGRVASIPVGVHWSALVIVALIVFGLGSSVLPEFVPKQPQGRYWVAAAVTGALFMASLLAHEVAHALVAQRRGIRVSSITLWVLGGVTAFEQEMRSPRTELETSSAGPLTSLALSGLTLLAMVVMPRPSLLASSAGWLAAMNLALGVFNLLPGAPLDGGRVLHALLWWRYKDRGRADRSAARAGGAVGALLMMWGVMGMFAWNWLGGLWLLFTGWFIAGAAREELTAKLAREGLRDLRVREVMTADPDLASAWLRVADLIPSVVLASHQSVFPVVDFGGAPLGTVSLERLLTVPAERRSETRVDTLVAGRRPPRILAPDDDAAELLEGPVDALVVEGGRVVGMVTADDLERIVRQALLRIGGRGERP